MHALKSPPLTTETMKRTFYFDTGVRPHAHTPPVPLSPGHVMRGGTMQIPFECEDVPDGAAFAFACDEPEGKHGMIARRIENSALVSQFAHFTPPIQ